MKPRLFFFHSNGFPARTYGHFLKTLETWNPEAINILGADLSSLGGTMDPMVEEVISQVAPAKGNAIGIGHSLGGSLCILAQASQPNLFQNMILLDPRIFSPLKRKCHPLAAKAGDAGMVQSFKKGPSTAKHLCQQGASPGVFCSQTFISGLSQILT